MKAFDITEFSINVHIKNGESSLKQMNSCMNLAIKKCLAHKKINNLLENNIQYLICLNNVLAVNRISDFH